MTNKVLMARGAALNGRQSSQISDSDDYSPSSDSGIMKGWQTNRTTKNNFFYVTKSPIR